MPSKRHLLRSSTVVAFFYLLGSISGIVVEVAIAAHLGLSRNSDVFYLAFTAPYIITNLISATGQFSLVPFFSSFGAAQDLGPALSYALNRVALALAAVAVAGAVLAPWIIRVMAPGFTASQSALSTQLARSFFFIIIPAGTAEIFRSFLFSKRLFAWASASGFIRNTAVIAFILMSFRRYGDYSIVMGYFAGYFCQMGILGAQVFWKFSLRYSPTLRGQGKAFRRLHSAGASQLVGALARQGVVIVERIIASFLPPGTITALHYGFKIMTTLSELVAGSVGTGALPALAGAVAQKAEAVEQKIVRDGAEIALFVLTPLMMCCLMVPRPMMQLIFQRGQFTPEATSQIAFIFFCYCLCLLPHAAVRLLVFYLFARHETANYLRLAGLNYGLTLGLDIVYVAVLGWGPKGIPLALLTSLAVTCATAYGKDFAGIRHTLGRRFASLAGKAAVAAVAAGLTLWWLSRWLSWPHHSITLLFFLSAVCGTGCAVYAALMTALGAFSLRQVLVLAPKR